MFREYSTLLFLILLFSQPAFAHPGRTNSEGCHNNRKTGDYHCHSSKAKLTLPTNNLSHELSQKTQNLNSSEKETEEVVYITATGKRYHRSGCRYASSGWASTKEDAIRKGLSPCKVCMGW